MRSKEQCYANYAQRVKDVRTSPADCMKIPKVDNGDNIQNAILALKRRICMLSYCPICFCCFNFYF